jgi:D-alanyl-lipoteichoic acid acyltransferase DltB (MBOAT superfamily)
MATMVLGGLWHGAAWTFVIWGGLHGLYLGVHRWMDEHLSIRWPAGMLSLGSSAGKAFGMFITFHLVLLSWIFFRAPGLGASLQYIQNILAFRGMEMWSVVLPSMLVPWLLVLTIDIPQSLANNHTILLSWPKAVRSAAIAGLLFLVLLGIGTRAPFIYFQF